MKESLPRQLLVLGLKYVCARNRAGGCNSTQLSGAIAPTLLCESEPEAAPAALPKTESQKMLQLSWAKRCRLGNRSFALSRTTLPAEVE
jgi:hypothetical protein